jgi:hypothetical protein
MPAEEIKAAEVPPTPPVKSKDEVALELMKFVASLTGYGKSGSGTGYGSTKTGKTPEEQADGLLELFVKCRTVVNRSE